MWYQGRGPKNKKVITASLRCQVQPAARRKTICNPLGWYYHTKGIYSSLSILGFLWVSRTSVSCCTAKLLHQRRQSNNRKPASTNSLIWQSVAVQHDLDKSLINSNFTHFPSGFVASCSCLAVHCLNWRISKDQMLFSTLLRLCHQPSVTCATSNQHFFFEIAVKPTNVSVYSLV